MDGHGVRDLKFSSLVLRGLEGRGSRSVDIKKLSMALSGGIM